MRRLLQASLIASWFAWGNSPVGAQSVLTCAQAMPGARADAPTCGSRYAWSAKETVAGFVAVGTNWGNGWPTWQPVESFDRAQTIAICVTAVVGLVGDTPCPTEGFAVASTLLYAPPPSTPIVREVPPCWPFPFGTGSRWYISYTTMSAPAAIVWYCDGAPVGFAGTPEKGIAALLSVVDSESASNAWQAQPWREMTDLERTIYRDLVANTRPAPKVYRVASTARATRPVYACDAQCLASMSRGPEIGRIAPGEVCDGPLSPVWVSGSNQWQYVTAQNGMRGVAVCSE